MTLTQMVREFNTVLQLEPYLTQREYDKKLERCEIEARWFFNRATQTQLADLHASTSTAEKLFGHGSKAHCAAIDLAKRTFADQTKEAAALLDRTVESYMQTGECSSELDDLWTELFDREQVAQVMSAAE